MADMTERCGTIRTMTDEDLWMVLGWRNDPEVRHFMYSQHEISHKEHRRWYETASNNGEQHLLIVEQNNTPFGFVNIKETGPGGIADWGFYTAPDSVKGAGSLLAKLALTYAFENLQLHKVCGQALAYNDESIRFHKRQGFKEEGVLREQHFDGSQYQSVVYFGLLKSEWLLKTEDKTSVI